MTSRQRRFPFAHLAAAGALVLALSGCTGPAATTTSGHATNPVVPIAPTTELVLRSCENFSTILPVPAGEAQAILPQGWTADGTSDPLGGVALYAVALHCAQSAVAGQDAGTAVLLYAELAAEPDAAHRVGNLTDCTVPVFLAASPPSVAQALQQLGLAATVGTATWTQPAPGGPVRADATLGGATVSITADRPGLGAQAFGAGAFVSYGVQNQTVVSTVLGNYTGGTGTTGAMVVSSQGAGILDHARAQVRGGSVTGFSLTYRLLPPLPAPASSTA